MISASVGVNSSLLLEPAQTLTFPLDPSTTAAAARACLTLTNISPRKRVVFKVRTTNVDMFLVKPSQGVIEPSSGVPIILTLLPPATARLLKMTPDERAAIVERFLIQSIDRSEDMRGFGIDDLATFWKRLPKELITNKKLTCRFVEARDAGPGVLLPLHRLRLQPDTPVAETQSHNNQLSPEPLRSPGRPTQDEVPPEPVATSSPSSPPKRPPPPPLPTPTIAVNMPSSPVPSLRPKAAFAPNSSSTSNDGDTNGAVVSTGDSNLSSHDSYGTSRVLQQQFDEHIPSDDVLEYRLHPSESLLFPVHHAYPDDNPMGIVEGKSYFFITNRARHSGLAFKIKTSNHSGYFVKPARGLIEAKSAQRVDVFVNAPDVVRFNAQDREMKDRFLVELLFVGPAKSGELLEMPEDRKRQELVHVWEASKAADRRQTVLSCQILEEDSPIDPKHQTAEQARALLQKSQVATTLSLGNSSSSNSLLRDSTGESAVPYVHPPVPPVSPAVHTPRGNQYQDYYQQNQHSNQNPYYQHQHQPRSPVVHLVKSRSPVKQPPRSPGVPPPQPRSPVRSQPTPPQQTQQYYRNDPMTPPHAHLQRTAFDDERTYYA